MKSASQLLLLPACIACATPAFTGFARGGCNGWSPLVPMDAGASHVFSIWMKHAPATADWPRFDFDGNGSSTQWSAGTGARGAKVA